MTKIAVKFPLLELKQDLVSKGVNKFYNRLC